MPILDSLSSRLETSNVLKLFSTKIDSHSEIISILSVILSTIIGVYKKIIILFFTRFSFIKEKTPDADHFE